MDETNAEQEKFRADLQIKPALMVPEWDQIHEKPVVEREARWMVDEEVCRGERESGRWQQIQEGEREREREEMPAMYHQKRSTL